MAKPQLKHGRVAVSLTKRSRDSGGGFMEYSWGFQVANAEGNLPPGGVCSRQKGLKLKGMHYAWIDSTLALRRMETFAEQKVFSTLLPALYDCTAAQCAT